MDIQRKSDVASSVPCQILESDAYASVMEYLEAEKKILDSSHLWKDLERIVYVAYPLLKNRLMLLASPSLKRQDLQIILLIKCGITPTQLTILLGKAKGTISSRRTAISERLFNQKLSNKSYRWTNSLAIRDLYDVSKCVEFVRDDFRTNSAQIPHKNSFNSLPNFLFSQRHCITNGFNLCLTLKI